MTRITELTAEQEARFSEFRDKWRAIGLCTDPADRPRAEKAIIEAYKWAGLWPPRKIVWCASPLSLALTRAVNLVDGYSRHVGRAVSLYYQACETSLRASVSDGLRDWVREHVTATGNIKESVWAAIDTAIRNAVIESPRDSFGDTLRYWLWGHMGHCLYGGNGQWDAPWLGVYDYFRQVCGLIEETERLLPLMELCKSAGWCLPHREICWVSERPNLLARDERGRLHNLTAPAIAYPDGWKIYAVHGVQVPGWFIEEPETITAERIESETNMEVRRVMIDHYGMERYLTDSARLPSGVIGAQIIHQDAFGILYRKLVRNDEPIVMVKVRNSTPEPDGSVKDYFLRVPPEIETARAAVAWTFGLRKKQYRPEIET